MDGAEAGQPPACGSGDRGLAVSPLAPSCFWEEDSKRSGTGQRWGLSIGGISRGPLGASAALGTLGTGLLIFSRGLVPPDCLCPHLGAYSFQEAITGAHGLVVMAVSGRTYGSL